MNKEFYMDEPGGACQKRALFVFFRLPEKGMDFIGYGGSYKKGITQRRL
jgi:hypothetical protein